jgi:hypothetical protein
VTAVSVKDISISSYESPVQHRQMRILIFSMDFEGGYLKNDSLLTILTILHFFITAFAKTHYASFNPNFHRSCIHWEEDSFFKNLSLLLPYVSPLLKNFSKVFY